jgi:hypothetical protein
MLATIPVQISKTDFLAWLYTVQGVGKYESISDLLKKKENEKILGNGL